MPYDSPGSISSTRLPLPYKIELWSESIRSRLASTRSLVSCNSKGEKYWEAEMVRNIDPITGAIGIVLVDFAALILISKVFSPSHSIGSQANFSSSEALGFLVGLGWFLITKGFLRWSKYVCASFGKFFRNHRCRFHLRPSHFFLILRDVICVLTSISPS